MADNHWVVVLFGPSAASIAPTAVAFYAPHRFVRKGVGIGRPVIVKCTMTEDDVLREVQRLAAAGEYLDSMLGVPGARLDGPGTFVGNQREYARGSPEYLEARAAGLIEKLPPLMPTTREAVEMAQRDFGYPLPSLLRRLYLEVGNGGFGPGYGILSLPIGEEHKAWRSLPPSLFPVCDWDCGISSFVDCADAEARMWGWDPNPAPHDDLDKALFREDVTLCQWLARWVSGELYQPVLVQDPESGAWRGATHEEKAAWMNES